MEFFFKNTAYVAYGMALIFFLATWLKLKRKKGENKIFHILYWMFGYMVVVCIRTFIYLDEDLWGNPAIKQINNSIDILFIPLVVIFFSGLISPRYVNTKNTLLIYIPFIILVITSIITLNDIAFMALVCYTIVFVFFSLIFLFWGISKHNNYIKHHFSNIESTTLTWLRKGLIILLAFLCLWSYANCYVSRFNETIYYLSMIILWGLLYKYAINYHFIEKIDDSSLYHVEKKLSVQSDFEKRLNTYVKDKKPYQNPYITLVEFAAEVGTNRTYMSNYLNKVIGVTFYDYINSFRVETACQLLIETDITLDQIADQSGFNSLPTFRRSFVKLKRCTPNQYRKKHKSKALV